MEIKIKYKEKTYDATVVSNHRVLIHGFEVDLYKQKGKAEIDIYLDQCKCCGEWLSENDGIYGEGYCEGCWED